MWQTTHKGLELKVMLKVLQPRLQLYVDWEPPEVQAGFRKGRETRDQIFHIWLIHTVKGFHVVNEAAADVFMESLAFSMIQWNLTIWSLVPLPFLNPGWTSGSSLFTMEYYSTIERNAFESVLMRLINLGSAIQSEVSQKEKRKYCIYMKSRKMVLMNLFVRQE